jgi:hypothetical protein
MVKQQNGYKTLHTENVNKMPQNNTVVEKTVFISH